MTSPSVVSRFNCLYLGDSLLQRMDVRTGEALCHLTFNAGKVLRAESANIFEPEASFAPAALTLRGVRSISWGGISYQLNSTVVDFGASIDEGHEHVEFYFDLTGGIDPGAFLVRLTVVASDFDFGSSSDQ